MIIKYNLYKESLLDKLEGPNIEDIKKNIKKTSQQHKDKLLKKAFLNGDYEFAKFLTDNGADVHTDIDIIIEHACRFELKELLEYLLTNYTYSKKTIDFLLLMVSSETKNKELIKLLEKYKQKNSILYKMKKYFHNESLLDKISGPNEEDVWNYIQTFSDWEKRMYECIRIGNVDFLQKIINQNPDYMFNKIHFKFPLEAMKHNDNETKYNIIKLLLDNGANLNEIHLSVLSKVMTQFNLDDRTRRMIIDDTNNKMNLRESLLDKIKGPSEEEFIKDFTKKKPLKRFGIFTNINNANDLLITSCEGGSLNGVKTAIENGADINYSNNAALTIVLSRGFLDIFIYLDDKFNLINKDTLFRSMISSIYSDDSNMLKYLIDNYSHKIKTDLNERELLLKCVERNNLDALKYLISLGCDFRYGNYQIYNIALNMKHYNILDYLLSLGEIKKSLSVYLYNTANYRNDEKLLNILKKYNIV